VREVSQVQYASFVIRYCRNDMNDNIRGSECTDALFFFPDLPIELQLEFVRYTSCVTFAGTTEDMTLEDCLANYNDSNELFYMENINKIPDLCNATFPLMITTDLLVYHDETNAPIATITTQPTTSITSAPTHEPTTTPIQNIDTFRLSSVGILGITITILFAMMFGSQCLLWQYRKHQQLFKKRQNDVMALQEDESVVASEHSHELQTPLTDDMVDVKSTSSSITNQKHATPRSISKSSHQHQNRRSKNVRFVYPPPLVTENLSENNPVNTRKRFSNKSHTGNFPFDEEAMRRVEATSDTSPTTHINDAINPTKQKNHSTTKLNVNTSVRASEVSMISAQAQPHRPIIAQSGKENSHNTTIPQQQRHHLQNNVRKMRNNNNANHDVIPTNKNEQIIKAVTFGNVIHTELKQQQQQQQRNTKNNTRSNYTIPPYER
jgi:hypothetical protein